MVVIGILEAYRRKHAPRERRYPAMIEVRHRMPGRERLRIRALYRNAVLAARLEAMLSGVDGVRMVRIKTLCASLVVSYDRRKLDADALHRLLVPLAGKIQPAHTGPVIGITPVDCADCRVVARSETKGSWITRIGTFVLLTGYLGYTLVRESTF